MEELNWLGKCRSYGGKKIDCDVILSTSYDSSKKKETSVISFRNRSHAKITQKEHMVFAVLGTKLYFKEASVREGYKLTTFNKDKSSCHIKIDSRVVKITDLEAGEYMLEWDKHVECYYVDINNKLNK